MDKVRLLTEEERKQLEKETDELHREFDRLLKDRADRPKFKDRRNGKA